MLCYPSLKMCMLGVSLSDRYCSHTAHTNLLSLLPITITRHLATVLWVASDDRVTVIATLCQVTRSSSEPLPAASTTRSESGVKQGAQTGPQTVQWNTHLHSVEPVERGIGGSSKTPT